MWGYLLFLLTVGCNAGASLVVKPPLVNQCQRLPIRGCPDLVDGVLLHVDGEETKARLKIEQVVHQNGNGQLKAFASVLRETAKAPGVDEYADRLLTVAAWIDPDQPSGADGLLDAQSSLPTERAAPSAGPPTPRPSGETAPPFRPDDTALRALSASADPLRLVTETVDFNDLRSLLQPCRLAGLDALCLRSREGPLIVTDVIGSPTCERRLFIAASISDTPDFGVRWLIEPGAAALTGARLLVRGGDWLQFGIVADKKRAEATECRVTWSAFQPWIVTR